MKIFTYFISFFLAFTLIVVGLLHNKGFLDKEHLGVARKKIFGTDGSEVPAVTEVQQIEDKASEFVRQVQEQSRVLQGREAGIEEESARISMQRTELMQLSLKISQDLTRMEEIKKALDEGASQRIKDVADSIASMEPEAAAILLEGHSVRDSVQIMKLLKKNARGEIFGAMKPEKAITLQKEMFSPLRSVGSS